MTEQTFLKISIALFVVSFFLYIAGVGLRMWEGESIETDTRTSKTSNVLFFISGIGAVLGYIFLFMS